MKRKNLNRKQVRYYISKLLDLVLQPVSKPNFLISGFYRSGTTWVQEVAAGALKAKTIFEPFAPFNRPPYTKRLQTQQKGPFFPTHPDFFTKADLAYLDRAFHGFCLCNFSYVTRYKLREAFRTQTLVKVIRGHFILPFLSERYHVPVIHIRRHPLAVVNSLQYVKWAWSFDTVSFKGLYPNATKLHTYESAEGYEKIAALWAYTESHVKPSDTIHILYYEDLVMNDMKGLFDIIGKTSDRVNVASAVSAEGRKNLDKKDRLYSWKDAIEPDKQSRVMEIIGDIAPELAETYTV